MIDTRAATMASSVVAARPAAAAPITRVSPVLAEAIFVPVRIPPSPAPPSDLPLLGSQNGHLLRNWPNAAVTWFLPAFGLGDDPDPLFGFAAAQSGVDSAGNPFNKARLTLSLKKTVPPDVASLKAAQPSATLREVPLRFGAATLAIAYKDQATGADRQANLTGTFGALADGSLSLDFENILGVNVVLLFENLRNAGSAVLTLTGAFDVWQQQRIWFMRVNVPTAAAAPRAAGPPVRPMMMMRPVGPPSGEVQPLPPRPQPPPPPPPMKTETSVAFTVPLGAKYAADAYLLKYTINASGAPRPILSVDDLRDYNIHQSEYMELHALGDVTQRYPSISRLYLGVLSRTIVIAPVRYAIMRGSDSCAASCQVLLDSSSQSKTAKFQFEFLLVPDLNPIELAQLAQEVVGHSDLKDCTITTPTSLKDSGSNLATVFKSTADFAAGSAPHSFALSVEITDAGLDSPAIANANLLIRQLCAMRPPYLSGTLDLRLDDSFPDPVRVPLVLAFNDTVGDDGLKLAIDESKSAIELTSNSKFDLRIRRYALCVGNSITVIELDQILKSDQTVTLPLPVNHTGLSVLVDREPIFDGGETMESLSRYLDIRVQDVQNVECNIGINAGAVDFTRRGITQLDAQVSFAGLPQLAPISVTLTPKARIGNATVPIPIQAAIGSLGGTILTTVSYAAAGKPQDRLTIQNDFAEFPLYVLADSVLDPTVPGGPVTH
jgi:hypothetical protein